MKAAKLLISIAFAAVILLASASAQTQIKTTIPFKFAVANQTIPAGDYKFRMLDFVLLVIRLDGSGSFFVQTCCIGDYKNDATPKLIFHRYGQRHFLSQAWIGNSRRDLFTSGDEREYARSMGQEQVIVLATTLPAK